MGLRKLAFFMIGLVATSTVAALLLGLAGASKSLAGWAVVVPLVVILLEGMPGVIAGGVAYMLRTKAEGRPESIRETCGFCARRFLSLFGGMLLVGIGLGLVTVIVNGLIALVAGIEAISLLAAVLFIPQVLFNLVLALASLTVVLVPCAIALKDLNAIEAIHSVIGLMRRDTAMLVVHTGLALFVGGVLSVVLIGLLLLGLMPTCASNGPDVVGGVFRTLTGPGSSDALADLSRMFDEVRKRSDAISRQSGRDPFESLSFGEQFWGGKSQPKQSRPSWESSALSSFFRGDWLRYLSLLVVFLGAISYPAVFWICAMSGFYERATSSA